MSDNKKIAIRENLPALLLLAGLVVACFLPVLLRMQTSYDFMVHNGLVEKMRRSGELPVLHPLYHLLTLAWSWVVFPENTSRAGVATILTAKVCSAGFMYLLLVRSGAHRTAALCAALGGVIATHVLAAYPFDHKILGGYLNPNVLHNPTSMILAPIALAQFWVAGRIFAGDASRRVQVVAVLATLLSVSAKPSYMLAFAPALVIMAGLRTLQRRPVALKATVLVLLCWIAATIPQYLFSFGQNQQQDLYSGVSSIAWLPLAVMSSGSGYLPLKLLASVAFPLGYLALFPRSLRDPDMQFAWITFLVSLVYAYFLAEQGPRMLHGNFIWTAQVSLFVLMFTSMRSFLCGRAATALPPPYPVTRHAVCIALFLLHIVSAIVYYAFEYRQPEMFW